MDNINFKKVLDDGELFDQQANYEENFEKINQEVVPKITDLETNKVDKVTGKGLSTNDYTTTEKNKLAGIPADTATQLSGKVDKVTGKGLSTNDFDNTYKQKIDTDIPAQLAQIAKKTDDLGQQGYDIRWNSSLVINGDWTNAIQNAIDNHEKVFIPEGTYNHTTIYPRTDTTIYGVGKKSILNNIGTASSIVIGNASHKVFDCFLSDFLIKSNGVVAGMHGIEFVGDNPAYHKISNVRIINLGGHGIYGGHSGHVNNIIIERCFIQGCLGNGIHMQYGIGQINALNIHDNDITSNLNGILFSGNSVNIHDNILANNKEFAISVSSRELIYNEVCFGSSIKDNYFEINGANLTESVSVIGIFCGYSSTTTTTNKLIRNLSIDDNYFNESGSKYASLIYIEDVKNSVPSNRACVLTTSNNYGNLQLLTYNKASAFSEGCVFDERSINIMPTSLALELPSYVEVRGRGKLQPYNTSRFMSALSVVNSPNITGQKYVITLHTTKTTLSMAEVFGKSILNVKVLGQFEFNTASQFVAELNYFGPCAIPSDVALTKSVSAVNTPTISPLSYIDYNGGKALQFTITPTAAGAYTIHLDFYGLETYFKYLATDVSIVSV